MSTPRLAAPLMAGIACLVIAATADGEEVLYNGIRLPSPWPPRIERLTDEPMAVPYLASPPAVIPIDVGRQLFVDDFLIEGTTLKRTFHRAEYCESNPVIRPDKPWEQAGKGAFAAVFSDGVWYDPADRLFKMWYLGSIFASTCCATSRDGLGWEKPALDVEAGTNVVHRLPRDSQTVWLDLAEKDPSRRFKMFTATTRQGRSGWFLAVRFSADGVHWSREAAAESSPVGDRSTVFYNPFRKVWVYSIRSGTRGRDRTYRECADPVAGATWSNEEKFLWVGADKLDPHNPNPDFSAVTPELYNLDAAAYESLMLGLFSVWQGPSNAECAKRGIHKRNEVLVGFSRDGFHWQRPDRRPFIVVNQQKGAWNWGNVQSAGGGCLVVGDRLYFYFSGRALGEKFWDGGGSTGLATLRRDGFASIDADDQEGTLTTRPVLFTGSRLFVNADAARGELAAEVLGEDGKVIEPFSRGNCAAIHADKTLQELVWKGADDLRAVSGKPVRFRFHLTRGSLYAFWVSAEKSGASRGYVAAGGPGFTSPTDTVGEAAYRAAALVKP
jgi:hypothetical protein